jgi:hypothetical protein
VKTTAVAVFVLLLAGGDTSAHRLDEYLQATRVSIGRAELNLELDLTPGASIASAIAGTLDVDADGAVSPVEAEAYGRAVLSDLVVKGDERPIAMTLARIEIPTIDEMRDGLGTIRLQASGTLPDVRGRHSLSIFNKHKPEASVYMVNALVPGDRDVNLGSQSRDPRQQEYRLEYTVSPRWITQTFWLALGVAGLALVVVARRNEKRKRQNE